MPVDTSMYLQNPLRTVADYEGQLINQRLNQQAIQQNALKMDEYGRTVNDQQRVRALLAGTDSPEAAVTLLRKNGYYDHAAAIEKEITARDKTRTDTAKNAAEINAVHVKLAHDMLPLVIADPRPETAEAVMRQWEKATGQSADALRASFANAGNDPAKIRAVAQGASISAEKHLPKIDTHSTGGALTTQAVDPISGVPTVTGSVPMTAPPPDVQDYEMRKAQAGRSNLSVSYGAPVAGVDEAGNPVFFQPDKGGGKPAIVPGVAPPKKDMPAALQEKLAQNAVTLNKIDKALQLAQEKPDAFGLKNYAGDAVMQRVDPGGVEARAMIADIGGQKIHDRSGAAVTVGEAERLKPYIPSAKDTPETVKKKLGLFRQEYVAMQQAINSGASAAQAAAKPKASGVVNFSDLK